MQQARWVIIFINIIVTQQDMHGLRTWKSVISPAIGPALSLSQTEVEGKRNVGFSIWYQQ
jgi:hypothetical protein